MKRINLITCIIILLWSLLPSMLHSQDFYNYTTKGACHGMDNGRLDLTLVESEISSIVDVSFPISIYVEDLNNSDVEWLVLSDDWQQTVEQLYAGDYRVTVDLNSSCSFQFDFSILESNISFDDALLTLKHPSSCSLEDGDVVVRNSNLSGEVGYTTFSFMNFSGEQVFPQSNPGGSLGAGTYYIIATDEVGCSDSYEFKLEAPYHADITMEATSTCSGQSVGTLGAYLNFPSGLYEFSWSNGFVETNVWQSEQEDLSSGNYCVTVTSMENPDCQMIQCIDIGVLPPSDPLVVNTNVIQPCPGDNNGQIVTNISGGYPPYTKQLNGANHTLLGLTEGDYNLIVTDVCGGSYSENIVLKSMEADFDYLVNTPACYAQGGSLSLYEIHVSGGTPPYYDLYKEVNFPFRNSDNVMEVFRIKDARGCMLNADYNPIKVDNIHINHKSGKTCAGLTVGNIEIEYNMPTLANYYLLLDNQNLSNLLEPTNSTQIINIGGLSAGDYSLHLDLNGCVYDEDVRIIESSNLDERFNNFDEDDNMCVYDQYCNGNLITSEGIRRSTSFSNIFNDAGWNGIFKCQLEKNCNGSSEAFGVLTAPIQQLPWWQYVRLYQDKLGDNRFSNIVRVEPFPIASDHRGCRPVYFCPLTMRILGYGFHNIGRKDWIDKVTIDESTGCLNYFCLNFSNNYCYDDVINDILPDSYINDRIFEEVFGDCEVRNENVAQLLEWEPNMRSEYDFLETELFKELDLIKTFIAQGNRNLYCADITFCLNTFEVVNVNIPSGECDLVSDCNDPYWLPDGTYVGPEAHVISYCSTTLVDGIKYLTCPDPNRTCIDEDCDNPVSYPCRKLTRILPWTPGILDDKLIGGDDKIKVLSRDDRVKLPKIAYQVDNGELSPFTYYGESRDVREYFSETASSPIYKDQSNSALLGFDASNNTYLSCYLESNNLWSIEGGYMNDEIFLNLSSTDFLSIKDFLVRDGNMYFVCLVKGTLNLNNQTLVTVTNKSILYLKWNLLDPSIREYVLVLEDLNVVDPESILSSDRNLDLDPSRIQAVSYNGTNVPIESNNTSFDWTRFEFRSTTRPRVSNDLDSLVFHSPNFIMMKNMDRNQGSNPPGNINHKYVMSLQADLTNESIFEIYPGSEENLIVRTTEDSTKLLIYGTEIDSIGIANKMVRLNKENIFLLYDHVSQEVKHYTVNNSLLDHEVIEVFDFMPLDDQVYFVSELSTNAIENKVGDYTFILDAVEGTELIGITSVIEYDNFIDHTDYSNLDNVFDNYRVTNEPLKISVFPNPSDGLINVSILTSNDELVDGEVQIFSIVGENVFSISTTLESYETNLTIDLGTKIPPGLYYIQFIDSNLSIKSEVIKFIKI